jgi:hypothetical protein
VKPAFRHAFAFCALGVAGLAHWAHAQEEPEDPAQEAASAEASANPIAGLDLESLTATRELPLFTPSRSPPTVIAPEPPPPEPEPVEPEIVEETDPEPPPLQLIGIVVSGAEQTVLLMDESSGEVQRVRPGEEYAGWTVTVLDSRSVELESEGHFQTLTMFTETGEQADPAAQGEDWDGDGIPDEELPFDDSGEEQGLDEIPALDEWDADDTGVDEEAFTGEAAGEESFDGENLEEQ